MIKAIRGTRDILPPESETWNFVEAAARDVFRLYNFHEIRTPVIESLELFRQAVGEDTDIISKEMFTWQETGRPAEWGLNVFWLLLHGREYPSWEVPPRFPGVPSPPDLLMRSATGEITVVDFKRTISLQALQQIERYADALRGVVIKGSINLLLVTNEVVPKALRAEAEGKGIRIEEIRLPDSFEAPHWLALRPENTAGVVRAYIEHKLWEQPGLAKLYYMGPQFRRERPQKGRYRQFYQIGAEVIGPPTAGSESPARDAEVLEMLATLLDRLGITGWRLELNSVGCTADRARFNEALKKALSNVVDKMCADCQRRAQTNPLRVFDCKVPADQPIIEKLPRISDYLDEPCRQHFAEVQEILKAANVPSTLNNRLVRGLDYYTRTAFEFTHGALGAQNAILGGGRYDGLSEALGGPKAPGIGFAIGEDRLVMALQESSEAIIRKPDAYIAPLGEGMDREAARLARELRHHDVAVELGDASFRLKKSLETASKLGARFAVIVGENEVQSGQFAVKNLATGEQVNIPRPELAKFLTTHPR